MHTTEALLVALGITSIIAAIPQLITLLKRKKSDQFNLFSWSVWFMYQFVSCLYSYSIEAYPYLFINILWTLFYAVMIIAIVKFRISIK